jgi:acyl-CoA synthetase (AMP-forming)/AMP-acid ligase II
MIDISDSAVLIDADGRMSGAELRDEVQRVARALIAQGLQPGDRVLVVGRKSVQLTAALLAVPEAGGIGIAPYLGLSSNQWRHVVCDASPVLSIVLDSAPVEILNLVRKMVPAVHYESLQQNAGATQSDLPDSGPSEPALIIYTSGSTGRPKGVVFSHENLRLGAESVAEFYGLCPSDRILCLLPFCFDAGLNQLLSALRTGCAAYLMDFLLPQHTARACDQHEITTLTGVPALWRQLNEVSWTPAARESLRRWASTGGHMPIDLSHDICNLFPNAEPILMYGFTEAFRATYLPPERYAEKPTSIGVPIPHAAIAVVGEDGGLCGPGEIGELVQFGPLVTLGYWNRPEDSRSKFRPIASRTRTELMDPMQIQYSGVTADQIDRAVWSGDNVLVDEDGSLFFHSRRSLLIKSQGFRVSPTEIEDACRATGLVRDSFAFGIDLKGEEMIAVVAVPASSGLHWEDLHRELITALPSYQVPRVIRFRDSLPLTATGKYDLQSARTDLKREWANANE